VPVEWLKKEWRARGLLKRVQLSISGCLGPCDVPNVVTISNEAGTLWLGQISEFQQYQLCSRPMTNELQANQPDTVKVTEKAAQPKPTRSVISSPTVIAEMLGCTIDLIRKQKGLFGLPSCGHSVRNLGYNFPCATF
jgi:hypothetical protein